MIKVPYAQAVHGQEEIDAVVDVLKTSTQMGKSVNSMEKRVASMFDKKYGLLTNSGSSALYLAVEAAALPRGSEVITAALTFATTVAPLIRGGLVPVFVDAEKDTLNVNASRLEDFITKRTSAIWIPNLLGNVPDWDIIRELANKYNLFVLEDSADTLGTTLRGRPTGSRANMSITSFYGSHIINCAGNGGWLGVDDPKQARKARLLRSWGRTSSIFSDIIESESLKNRLNVNIGGIAYDAKFIFEELGFQMEPSEIGAAYGLVQLSKFAEIKKKRVKAFKRMETIFSKHLDYIRLCKSNPDADLVWMHFPFIIKDGAPFNRRDLQIYFEERGIQTRPPFSGNVMRQPMLKGQKFLAQDDSYENSDDVMKNGVLLGCHQGLVEEQFVHVEEVTEKFFHHI